MFQQILEFIDHFLSTYPKQGRGDYMENGINYDYDYLTILRLRLLELESNLLRLLTRTALTITITQK